MHRQPMISLSRRSTSAFIPEKLRILAIVIHQKILPAVVIVISHRKPAPHSRRAKIRALRFVASTKFPSPRFR